jgi:hypothetical protein
LEVRNGDHAAGGPHKLLPDVGSRVQPLSHGQKMPQTTDGNCDHLHRHE